MRNENELKQNNPLARHSGVGRNPERTKTPQSGQIRDVDPLSRAILNQLDSGLRRNDAVLVNELSGVNAELGMRSAEFHSEFRNQHSAFEWVITI